MIALWRMERSVLLPTTLHEWLALVILRRTKERGAHAGPAGFRSKTGRRSDVLPRLRTVWQGCARFDGNCGS